MVYLKPQHLKKSVSLHFKIPYLESYGVHYALANSRVSNKVDKIFEIDWQQKCMYKKVKSFNIATQIILEAVWHKWQKVYDQLWEI